MGGRAASAPSLGVRAPGQICSKRIEGGSLCLGKAWKEKEGRSRCRLRGWEANARTRGGEAPGPAGRAGEHAGVFPPKRPEAGARAPPGACPPKRTPHSASNSSRRPPIAKPRPARPRLGAPSSASACLTGGWTGTPWGAHQNADAWSGASWLEAVRFSQAPGDAAAGWAVDHSRVARVFVPRPNTPLTVTRRKQIRDFQVKFPAAGGRKKSFPVHACGPARTRLLAFPCVSWNLGLMFRGLFPWSRTPGAPTSYLHVNFPVRSKRFFLSHPAERAWLQLPSPVSAANAHPSRRAHIFLPTP